MFDVDEWWTNLTDQERELAQRHADDDPLHPEVVRQLNAAGVMTSEANQGEVGARHHWTSEVRDFLAGGCE
jgi:hypothetical protein